MSILTTLGMPGVRAKRTAAHRRVFKQYSETFLAQGRVIDGVNSADCANTPDTYTLQAGKLMGQVTATGLYRNSVIGLTTAAYTSGGTSLTVPAAVATEIARLIALAGASISLNVIGPPTANGTLAVISTTCSAASGTTLTITNLGANMVSGAIVAPNDGSQIPKSFINDGYGLKMADVDGNRLNVPFPELPTTGIIEATQLIDWPADTSIQTWIVQQLNAAWGGQFVFDYKY